MNENKSMIEIAYEVLKDSNKALSFKALFDEVASTLGYDDGKKMSNIGLLYTDLTLDGRFVLKDGGLWELRERCSYADSHSDDISNAYNEMDDSSELDEEDKKEEKEYNAEISGESLDEEDSSSESSDSDDDNNKLSDDEASTLLGK